MTEISPGRLKHCVRILRFSATMLPACLVAWTPNAAAQTSPAYEVVAIKTNHSGSADSNLDSTRGRLTATNVGIRELIHLAFGVKDYQIAHAPAWIDKERYDIAVKTDGERKSSLEDEKELLRQLLGARFHLTTHRETRQLPVYLLVIGKNGPKVTPHNDGTGSGTRRSCGHLAGTRLTMDTIATVLSRQFEREVRNQTGLEGKFDFQLDWTPDSGPCAAGDADGNTIRPSVFTAVQEQMGLKLESDRGPVEVLVIDRIERPSEN